MKINTEDDFQRLLSKKFTTIFPTSLIGKENISWLFIGREIWTSFGNVDLVFFDQDAVPYLIECKLQKNPDCKGKIISQLLEYAAHSKLCWTSEFLKDNALSQVNFDEAKLFEKINTLSTQFNDIDTYFKQAENNITSGKINLVLLIEGILPERLFITLKFLTDNLSNDSGINFHIFEFKGLDSQIDVISFSEQMSLEKLVFNPIPDFKNNLTKNIIDTGQNHSYYRIQRYLIDNGLKEQIKNNNFSKFLYRNHVVSYIGVENNKLYFELFNSLNPENKFYITPTIDFERILAKASDHIIHRKKIIDKKNTEQIN